METPELSNDAILVMLRLRGINLNCVLTPLNVALEPEVSVKSEIDTKTPSQRLRNTFYAVFMYYKETGQVLKEELFEPFYNRRMELIIEKVKEELP